MLQEKLNVLIIADANRKRCIINKCLTSSIVNEISHNQIQFRKLYSRVITVSVIEHVHCYCALEVIRFLLLCRPIKRH